MGLFSKKKEEKEGAPSLPELPKLPVSGLDNQKLSKPRPTHKLPSYPSSSLGTKFSQDTIKNAVSGNKSDDFLDEEIEDDEFRTIQGPKNMMTKEIGRSNLEMSHERDVGGPVFIRIDKFEDAMQIFRESKNKISEIERILSEIKKVKEKEEKELQSWENEVRSMKEQIAKIDRDIFSKV